MNEKEFLNKKFVELRDKYFENLLECEDNIVLSEFNVIENFKNWFINYYNNLLDVELICSHCGDEIDYDLDSYLEFEEIINLENTVLCCRCYCDDSHENCYNSCCEKKNYCKYYEEM